MSLRLATGQITVIVPDAFDAHYTPTGHLVFAREGVLLAASFDVNRLELAGPPVVMLEHVRTEVNNGAARYDIANDGTLVYAPAVSRAGWQLAWIGPHGVIERLPASPRAFTRPALSPDGKRIAVQIDDESKHDIWICDVASGALTRLTFDGISEPPIWMRDGQRVTCSICWIACRSRTCSIARR